MRIIKKLAVFSLASLITFGLGVTVNRLGSAVTRYFSEPSAWQVLLSFENQDLAGLDEQSVRVVQRAIDAATATVDTNLPFLPRIFRKIANTKGESRYILVEESPLRIIPGSATIRVHIFDTAGRVLSKAEFKTGNRRAVLGIKIRKNEVLGAEALILDLGSWLAGHPFHQYYMVVGNELRLVYLDADGQVAHNCYEGPNLTIGPRLNLSADDWERALQSSDTGEVLSALTWLAGSHWNGQEAPYDEDRADAEKVTDLRARESVRRRLAELTNSTNFLIKSTAEAACRTD